MKPRRLALTCAAILAAHGLLLAVLLSGCASAPLDPRDPAVYRPAPAKYPALP